MSGEGLREADCLAAGAVVSVTVALDSRYVNVLGSQPEMSEMVRVIGAYNPGLSADERSVGKRLPGSSGENAWPRHGTPWHGALPCEHAHCALRTPSRQSAYRPCDSPRTGGFGNRISSLSTAPSHRRRPC